MIELVCFVFGVGGALYGFYEWARRKGVEEAVKAVDEVLGRKNGAD
jgi:hypothetical protein